MSKSQQVDAEYLRESIRNLSVEYTVNPAMAYVSAEAIERKIEGSKISVNRVSDGKLIASAEYYWDKNRFKVCPQTAHRGHDFIKDFIFASLNIGDESNSLRAQFISPEKQDQ